MSISKRVGARFGCAPVSTYSVLSALLRVVAIAAVWSGSALTATAGVNTFTPLGAEGGMINKIVFNPENESIAFAAASSGFYRSTNGGQEWQLVSDAFINVPLDFVLHPSDPDRIFIASGGGLYLSTDGGLTILQVSTFPEPSSMSGAIEIGSDGTLYVVSGGRVFHSIDGDGAWTPGEPATESTDEYVSLLRVDPQDAQTVYAVVENTNALSSVVLRSDNRGATWEATIALPGPDTRVNDLQFVGSTPERIWLATNTGTWSMTLEDGATWQQRTAMPSPVLRIEVDPVQPQTVYAGYVNGLYKSTNEGLDWVSEEARTGIINTIAIAPSSPAHVLVGGFEGVVGSLNAGATWTALNRGIFGARADTVVASAASDRIYVGTSFNGVHFIEGETLDVDAVDNEELRSLTFDPSSLSTRSLHVASQSPDELWVSLGAGVAESRDGGASWRLHTTFEFTNTGGVRFVSSATIDEQRVYLVGTETALFRSTDLGVTWATVSGLDDYRQFGTASASSASNPAVLFMSAVTDSDANVLLRSEDGGETWEPTAWPASALILGIAVDPTDERVLYVGSDKVRKSTDSGATWTPLEWSPYPQSVWAVAVDPQNTNILFASDGTSSVRRSVDGGQTWESLPGAEPPSYWDVRSLAVDPNRPWRLFAAAQDHGVLAISIEPDLVLEASGPIVDGETHQFVLEAINEGPFDATGVRTIIILNGGATLVEASMDGGSCTSTPSVVTCTRPILRNAASSEVSILIAYADEGNPSVAVLLEGEQLDPVPMNNSAQLVGEFVEVADLVVEMSGPATLAEGSPASYTVTARNEGPTGATNAEVRFTSTLVAATAVPSTGTCTVASDSVECVIPTLAAGESVSIAITTEPSTAGTHTSTATVTASGVDPADTNNSSSVSTTVAAAPAPPPPPPPTPTPPVTSPNPPARAGGGGGGSSSVLLLGVLIAFAALRSERVMRRNSRGVRSGMRSV